MGQRRIGFTPGESLLLTIDRGSVIAYEVVDGGIKWTFSVADRVSILSVVYASTTALPSDVAAGPWRSLSSASTAVALDSEGTVHALDAVLGRKLGTVKHEGEPVTLAAAGDALAVAFADRVLLYRGGTKEEIAKKGSALAFSRDGLTLAIGTARGEVFFFDLSTKALTTFTPAPGGHITDIIARPGGGWLVSSERGLTALHGTKNEKQLNGAVIGAAVDASGQRLAVHRSEANVVLYAWPPTVPQGRVSVTGGTIRDLAYGPDDKLGIALAGGGAAMIDPTTYGVLRTAPRPDEARPTWLVSAESEEARKERTAEQTRRAEAHEPKSGLGARLGVGGMISLAILVVRIFLVGARASTPSYSYTPAWTPPTVGQFGDLGLCDDSCERVRLAAVMGECQRSPESACLTEATSALDAFKRGDCATSRTVLEGISHANLGSDAGVNAVLNVNLMSALKGLDFACAMTAVERSGPKYQLKRIANDSHEAEDDETLPFKSALTPGQPGRFALWSSKDGTVFIGERHHGNRCDVIRMTTWGVTPVHDLADVTCGALGFFGRSSSEVYVNFGLEVRRFDGTSWSLPMKMKERIGSLAGLPAAGGDVFALTEFGDPQHKLFQINGKTLAEPKLFVEDPASVELFSGSTAVWAYGSVADEQDFLFRLNGKAWTRQKMDSEPDARAFTSLWQSPKGDLFITKDTKVARSKDSGVTWEDFDLGVTVDKLWGRSSTDVYAAGPGGLHHFDGTEWFTIGAYRHVMGLAGNAKDVFLIAQKR